MDGMEKGLTWVAATRRSEPELTSGRSHLEDMGQNRSQLRETNVEDIMVLVNTHKAVCTTFWIATLFNEGVRPFTGSSRGAVS